MGREDRVNSLDTDTQLRAETLRCVKRGEHRAGDLRTLANVCAGLAVLVGVGAAVGAFISLGEEKPDAAFYGALAGALGAVISLIVVAAQFGAVASLVETNARLLLHQVHQQEREDNARVTRPPRHDPS
jgi:hypothetical protein